MLQWRIKIYWWVSSYQKQWLSFRFHSIFHLFNKTLDKHAPMNQRIKKDKKLEPNQYVYNNPWNEEANYTNNYQQEWQLKQNQDIWNLQKVLI